MKRGLMQSSASSGSTYLPRLAAMPALREAARPRLTALRRTLTAPPPDSSFPIIAASSASVDASSTRITSSSPYELAAMLAKVSGSHRARLKLGITTLTRGVPPAGSAVVLACDFSQYGSDGSQDTAWGGGRAIARVNAAARPATVP